MTSIQPLKPMRSRPANVHPGQPMPGASSPISPSASAEENRNEQLRQQRTQGNSTVKPQPEAQSQGRHPLFDGNSSAIADQARQTREQARETMVHGARVIEIQHPGASSKQSPNDSGTRGARVPG